MTRRYYGPTLASVTTADFDAYAERSFYADLAEHLAAYEQAQDDGDPDNYPEDNA